MVPSPMVSLGAKNSSPAGRLAPRSPISKSRLLMNPSSIFALLPATFTLKSVPLSSHTWIQEALRNRCARFLPVAISSLGGTEMPPMTIFSYSAKDNPYLFAAASVGQPA